MIPQELQPHYNMLVEQVHAPLFFEKLASDYGIVARTQEERAELLELAGILQVERAKEQVKQASAGSP